MVKYKYIIIFQEAHQSAWGDAANESNGWYAGKSRSQPRPSRAIWTLSGEVYCYKDRYTMLFVYLLLLFFCLRWKIYWSWSERSRKFTTLCSTSSSAKSALNVPRGVSFSPNSGLITAFLSFYPPSFRWWHHILFLLRQRYAALLDRIPWQVKGLHSETLAQRALDRRLTEEIMSFRNSVTKLNM